MPQDTKVGLRFFDASQPSAFAVLGLTGGVWMRNNMPAAGGANVNTVVIVVIGALALLVMLLMGYLVVKNKKKAKEMLLSLLAFEGLIVVESMP